MKTLREKRGFTLVELMVSLSVFAAVMALVMQCFVSEQRLCVSSAAKTEMFENARVAMDLIENDLLCAYYSYGHSANSLYFYPVGNSNQLGFATMRGCHPNVYCNSYLCETQYKLLSSGKKSRLMTNVVGDYNAEAYANTYYDISSFPAAVSSTSNPFTTYDDSVYDVSSPAQNLDGWAEVVPYVVDFSFSLFNKKGSPIASKTGADFIAQSDKMPYTVLFNISLADRDTYARYFAKHPDADLSKPADFSAFKNDPDIKASLRTFTRRVTIERGQYD